MQCKLRNSGFEDILKRLLRGFYFVGLLTGLFSKTVLAEDILTGYRGVVPGAIGQTIKALSLRADGRYLVSSSGDSSFQVLDMQDMATKSPAVATNGLVFALQMATSTRLIVATSQSVQYFNLATPLEPKEETQKFSRNTSETSTSVMDACMDDDHRVYFLERGQTNQHFVRIVQETQEVSKLTWQNLFKSEANLVSPVGIQCFKKSFVVLANRLNSELSEYQFWISAPDSNPIDVLNSISSSFSRSDYLMNAERDRLLILLNRKNVTSRTKDDARILQITSDLSSLPGLPLNASVETQYYSLGSGGQALASFFEGGLSFLGFFVEKDSLYNLDAPPSNRFLVAPSTELTQGHSFKEGGVGLASAGGKRPSLWVSSKSDVYSIGAITSSGLTLVSKAPLLEFASNPMGQEMSSSNPVSFTLRSDKKLDYTVRFDIDANPQGDSSGISTRVGKVIEEGHFDAGSSGYEKSIRLSPSTLGVVKNKTYSVLILARDPEASGTGLEARTGLSFNYDPPPGAPQNFRVGFGDMSAEAIFGLPADGDITRVQIHFSYDPSDLTEEKMASEETRQVDTGVGTLQSPIDISASSFSGRYVLHPLQNGRKIYLRARIKDKKEWSTNNPEALGVTPYRTLTIPQALGGVQSCSLQTSTTEPWMQMALGFFFIVVLRALRKKLGPARLRNRRGGD